MLLRLLKLTHLIPFNTWGSAIDDCSIGPRLLRFAPIEALSDEDTGFRLLVEIVHGVDLGRCSNRSGGGGDVDDSAGVYELILSIRGYLLIRRAQVLIGRACATLLHGLPAQTLVPFYCLRVLNERQLLVDHVPVSAAGCVVMVALISGHIAELANSVGLPDRGVLPGLLVFN